MSAQVSTLKARTAAIISPIGALAYQGAEYTIHNEEIGPFAQKLYDDLLRGRLNVNLGMVFENMVAQELTMTGHSLVFAKFEHDDSNYLQEVDFVIPEGGKVIPVECKSGVSTRHVSLDRFLNKYGKSVKHAYVVHGKDLRVDGDITYIPIYMTMFI